MYLLRQGRGGDMFVDYPLGYLFDPFYWLFVLF